MSKADNPILRILESKENAQAAEDAQTRASTDWSVDRLRDWIQEAGLGGIKIESDVLWDGTWIDVVRPTGPAHVRYEGDRDAGYFGEIFSGEVTPDALDSLRRIVNALEKGTARIRVYDYCAIARAAANAGQGGAG